MQRRQLLKLFSAAGAALGISGCANSSQESKGIALADKPEEEWKALLSKNQYYILFEDGTEPAGTSQLNKEKRDGTYICAACYQPVFNSDTKYESGTGWPSFYDYIPQAFGFSTDYKIGYPRTEYHCSRCGGHHGHVFKDGPRPTGKRYCNNGLALQFVPKGTALPELRG